MGVGNPIFDVHSAIWTMLEAKTSFTDRVLANNRIKYTASAREILRRTIKAAQTPEVAVVQTGLGPADRIASNDSELRIRWEVWVTTGEQQLGLFLDVQWAVYRCLLTWDTYLRETLTWQGEYFVRNCELLDTKDSLLNEQLNRGQFGWSSVWVGESWCEFSHSKLIAGT